MAAPLPIHDAFATQFEQIITEKDKQIAHLKQELRSQNRQFTTTVKDMKAKEKNLKAEVLKLQQLLLQEREKNRQLRLLTESAEGSQEESISALVSTNINLL